MKEYFLFKLFSKSRFQKYTLQYVYYSIKFKLLVERLVA